MINKRRGVVLSALVSALVGSLILSACGSGYNPNNVNEIKLEMPFGDKSDQVKSMNKVVAKYNDFVKTPENVSQGYLPVKAYASKDKYDISEKNITVNLTVHNYSSLPNLTFNYPSLAMNLAKFQANLDFSEPSENTGKTVTYKDAETSKTITLKSDLVDKKNFNQSLLNVNDNIENLAPHKLYVVPAGTSTDVLYFSKPVMYYLLSQLINQNSVTIDSADTDWFEQNFGVKPKNGAKQTQQASNAWTPTDQTKVAEIWGTVKTGSQVFKSYTLKKSIFDNWYDLLDFANKINSGFDKKAGRVVAFDSIANAIEVMAFNELKYDYNQFLWNKSANNSYTYPYLKNSESEQAKTFKKVYEKLSSLSNSNNGLWLKLNKHNYSSADLNTHKLLFNVGTNSAYSYYVNTKKTTNTESFINTPDELLILPQPSNNTAPKTNSRSSGIKGSYTVKGGSLIGINFQNDRLNRATRLFVQWLTSDTSKIFDVKSVNNKKTTQTTKKVNGVDFYAIGSSYLPTSMNFLNENDSNNYMQTIAAKAVLKQFQDRKNPNEYAAFSEPAAVGAGPFRKLIDTINSNKTNLTSYDEMLSVLKQEPTLAQLIKN